MTGDPPLPRRSGRSSTAPREQAAPFGSLPAKGGLRTVPVENVAPNPNQPRRRFDPTALDALTESVRERGVLQPVLVRPRPGGGYELIAGERRWRASRAAGRQSIPAYVRDADDTTALELALIENVAREDLSPVEEARSLRILVDDLHVSQRALAARIGRSQSDLANTLRLLELRDDVLDLIDRNVLHKGHGKVLLSEPDPARASQLAAEAARDGWSIRRLHDMIGRHPGSRNADRTSESAAATARRLAERLDTQIPGVAHAVRPRGTGFAIRLHTPDQETAEALVRLLNRDEAATSATRRNAAVPQRTARTVRMLGAGGNSSGGSP